jgi:hypothetical protein
VTPRPYMSVAQLAAVTPWTPKSIARLVARGVLVRGVHYFTLPGTGRRKKLIFKWERIVELIEGVPAADAASAHARREDDPDHADLTATEAALERLLVRHAPGEAPAPLPTPRRCPARTGDGARGHPREPSTP